MKISTLGAALLLGACCGIALGETLDPKMIPKTYDELWTGVDPRAEPLDVEELKVWEQDGVILKIVRYRIGVFKGQKAMMAAVYGYPKGASKLPGLVQIHGGGQYADSNAVLTNAKRGYATISISWAGRISAPDYRVSPHEVKLFWDGKTEDPHYKLTTDWGALDAYHAPSRYGQDGFTCIPVGDWTYDSEPSPRNNSWFLCTLAARRALTFLEQQPQVDPDRLGVYGHSMGGKLTVATAGTDDRVKAAAPSCGGMSDRSNKDPLHRDTVGDAPNLGRIDCPIVFLSPANDFHGAINDLIPAIREIKTEDWRVVCTPHANHQDVPESEVATQLWFDQYLKGSFTWPASPGTKLNLAAPGGIPTCSVTPDTSRKILSVDVYFTQQGEKSGDRHAMQNRINRFWHHAPTTQVGNEWVAQLPLAFADKELWVYANVVYALNAPVSGAGYYYGNYTAERFNLSSLLQVVNADALAAAGVNASLNPSHLIEDFQDDWQKEWFTYRPAEWGRSTHKVYHPRWAAPGGASLAFEIRSAEANKVVVGLDAHAAEVEITGGNSWNKITLTAAAFQNGEGKALENWTGLKELRLVAQDRLKGKKGEPAKVLGGPWKGSAPEFRNLRWVP